MSRAGELIQLFKRAPDKPRTLEEISDEFGWDEKQTRSEIDAARNSGKCIVSVGRGTETWKLGYCCSNCNSQWQRKV